MTVARYGAIGSRSRHTKVSLPAALVCEARTPFASTQSPVGTVTSKRNVALSAGVSLTGNQVGAPCGSLATKAPSGVAIQPSSEPSGSVVTCGVPA